MRTALVTLLILSIFGGCRKSGNLELIIRGSVVDYRHTAGVAGVTVRLDEQVVEGGTVSGAYNLAANTTTDANGDFELQFDRKNALNYRITLTKDGYFTKQFNVNPDQVNPGEVHEVSEDMIPEATLQIRVVNTQPESDDELMRFRKLNAFFECVCCNNEFYDFQGAAVDSTFSCKLYGDYNVTYTYTVNREEEVNVVDSVYCPAFHTTELLIEY